MADPLDILTGRAPQGGGDEWGATLGNLAAAIASIPERRARAALLRSKMETQEMEQAAQAYKVQDAQRKVADLQAIDAAWQSGDRDAFISRLPGHLQIATRKGMAELEESDAKRRKALEEARKASDDTIARTLQFIAGTGYDPHLAQGSISELKRMYADDPSRMREFELVEKALQENPTPDHVKMITDALIRRSDEQRKADEAAAKSKADVAHTEAQTRILGQEAEGTKPIQPTDRARIDAENARAEAARAAQARAQDEAARHNRATEAGSTAGRAEAARHNAAMEASKTTDKPPTGQQNRALGFFNRARQADDDLEAIEGDINALGVVGQERLKRAPNALQSEAGQKYHQARRAFTEARLRKDSGATIKDSEYEADEQTYFPQPFDSKETLEQKRRARANVLASLAAEAGDSALRNFYGDDGPGLVDVYRSKSAKPQAKKNPFRP